MSVCSPGRSAIPVPVPCSNTAWADTISVQFLPGHSRIATREEVADLVCFVASTRAAFINGQNLRIDGGALGLVQ